MEKRVDAPNGSQFDYFEPDSIDLWDNLLETTSIIPVPENWNESWVSVDFYSNPY